MAEDKSIINYDNIIAPTDTFDVLFKNIDILEARLKKLAKEYNDGLDLLNVNDTAAIEKQAIAIRKLELAEEKLRLKKEALARAQKKKIELTQEELVQAQAEKIQNQERIRRAKQLAIIRTQERNTIKSLRAQLSLVSLDWSKLTEEEIKNSKTAKELSKRKLDLTNQLKRLEKQTGDNRREVGNYDKASKKLGSTLKRLFVGRTIADGILRLGAALGNVIDKNKDTNEELGKLSQTFSIIKNLVEDATVAFLELVASPVSKFLLNVAFAVEKVKNFFTSASESTGLFGLAIKGLTFTFNTFLIPIKTIYSILLDFPAIFGGIINVFTEFSTVASSTFENLAIRAERAFLEIERGLKAIAGADVADLDNRINDLSNALLANQEAGQGLFDAYERGYADVKQQQEDFNKLQQQRLKDQEKEASNEKNKSKIIADQNRQLQEQKRLTIEITNATNSRVEAIQELQKKIEVAEVGNIKDRQQKALSLEQLRFKEEQKQREQNFISFVSLIEAQEEALINLYGKNDERVIEFREEAGKELLRVEKLNLDLSEEQLEKSEQNKLDIRKKFALSTKELTTIDALGQDDGVKELLNEEVSLVEEANEKKKDSYEDLSKSIVESTAAASEAIQGIFDQELKAATDAVEAQETAVSNAEARAQAGLENSLKFEQEQLAKKELERQQAEKRAQQAAEALALINLTVAAAQSGDQNAVQTGLVQFGVLKGLIAAIGSFYHGTEDTGTVSNPLDSKGGRLAILHNNERVMTAKQNKAVGDMTNEQLVENAILGAAKTDHFNPSMFLGSNHFQEQTKQVLSATSGNSNNSIDVSGLKDEMRATRRAIEKKPVVQETLTRVIKDVAEITRKTTTNRMTRTEVIKNRL